MREWEQQLNHAGQRPIRSLLFSLYLSPSAFVPSCIQPRCCQVPHTKCVRRTKSLARPNDLLETAWKNEKSHERSSGRTTCNVCRRSSLGRGVAPAKSSFQRVLVLSLCFYHTPLLCVCLFIELPRLESFLPAKSHTDDMLISDITLVVPLRIKCKLLHEHFGEDCKRVSNGFFFCCHVAWQQVKATNTWCHKLNPSRYCIMGQRLDCFATTQKTSILCRNITCHTKINAIGSRISFIATYIKILN